jgi:GDP-L-fucose synthase
VVVWGDGSAIRDFAFSRDVAEGILLALHHGTRGQYVNLGSGLAVTIRELVETLAKVVPFNYSFDASKPSGFPRRIMDVSRAREWIGYEPSTSLQQGLKATWDWFLQHQNEYLSKKNHFVEPTAAK